MSHAIQRTLCATLYVSFICITPSPASAENTTGLLAQGDTTHVFDKLLVSRGLGELTVKRSPRLRIDARSGKVLAYSPGVLSLKRFPLTMLALTNNVKDGKITFTVVTDNSPRGGSWEVTKPLGPKTIDVDLVAKLSPLTIAQLKHVCAKLESGSKQRVEVVDDYYATEAKISYDLRDTADKQFASSDLQHRIGVERESKRHSNRFTVAIRLECVVPAKAAVRTSNPSLRDPSKARITPTQRDTTNGGTRPSKSGR